MWILLLIMQFNQVNNRTSKKSREKIKSKKVFNKNCKKPENVIKIRQKTIGGTLVRAPT